MNSEPVELNAVYEYIANTYQLRLKAQIVGTGIIMERVLSVHDITTNEQYFLLITRGKNLRFTDRTELIQKLLKLVDIHEEKVQEEIADLKRHQQEDLVDENAMFHAHERLGVRGIKLDQLKRRLIKLLNVPTPNGMAD